MVTLLSVRPDPTAFDVLDGDRLRALQDRLEVQREFRLEQLAALDRVGGPGLLGSGDDEVFTSLAAGARRALHDVQDALWRMADGTYGTCTSCRAAVDAERLESVPQAALCLRCQWDEQRAGVAASR